MTTTTNTPNAIAAHLKATGPQSHSALLGAGFWDSTIHRAAEAGTIIEAPALGGYTA